MTQTESNLVNHARRELELIGEEPETIDGILRIMQAFADMGHSGGSASVIIPWIHELLQFNNLKPLTDNPDEWQQLNDMGMLDVWQSRRRADAFSTDGGKTYYTLGELKRRHWWRKDKERRRVMHKSVTA